MAQRRESSLKNHRRAFAPSLFPCPMAVSEIEKERREKGWRRKDEEEEEEEEEEGGGFVLAFMH